MNASAPHSGALDLAGAWRLESSDGRISAAITLPGDVHSALIAAGIIPDPYVGRNEYEVRWVADRDWRLTRDFEHPGPSTAHWYLDIDGIDTVAEVTLNGTLVLEAQNAFRRYRPDVTADAAAGRNTHLDPDPLGDTGGGRTARCSQPFPIPYAAQNSPIPHGNMLRKPACHFGWDWNIALAPLGVYGAIALKPMRQARIEHVQTTQQHHDDGSVVVDVAVTLFGAKAGTAPLMIRFAGRSGRLRRRSAPARAFTRHASPSTGPISGGRPAAASRRCIHSKSACDGDVARRRVGLRNIELVTDADAAGSALRLPRQRPRDLLPRRQLDPGRRAAVAGNAAADAKAACRRRPTPT